MLGFPLGILSAAGAGGVAGTYELVSTQVLGTAVASVSFDVSSLGSTYRHLQIRQSTRRSSTSQAVQIRFNGVSTNSYSSHNLTGNGTSVVSAAAFTANNITLYPDADSGTTASIFGAAVIDILDPFSSTKNKTIRSLSAGFFSGPTKSEIQLYSGCFQSTAATTSISIAADSGNFVIGSRFSIYGIRG